MAIQTPNLEALLEASFISKETKQEIKSVLETLKTGTYTVVNSAIKTIGNITRFNSKIEPGKVSINLIEFYKPGKPNQPLWIRNNLHELIMEATENGKLAIVEINNETISQYENTESASDHKIMADLRDNFIDLTTDPGRLEARKRLAILATMLQRQPKGQPGMLKNNEHVTIIGWFKFPSGALRDALVCWVGGWCCSSNVYLGGGWNAGGQFWSRNEPRKK